MILRIAISFVLAAILGTCPAVKASILSTSGAVSTIAAPPDVSGGAIESDATILAFAERQNIVLSQDIAVDISVPGTSPSGGVKNLSPGTITSSTHISSYFIHFDAVGNPAPESAVPASGSITFDTDVLGLIVLGTSINLTDPYPGLPGTIYATGELNRGLEIPSGPAGTGTLDLITLSADRRTVSFNFRDGAAPDDIRIITNAVPEPSAIALAAMAGAILLARSRFRRSKRLESKVGRTMFIAAICGVACLGLQATARANFLFAHHGDANPTTEGFTGHLVFGAPSTFGPIANDLGNPAWSVVGTAQSSQYSYTSGALTAPQLADIANHGFTLTIVARALQNIAPTYDPSHPVAITGGGLNTGAQRFDIALGLNSSGDTVVFLFTADDAIGPGSSLVGAGPSYTLTGAGNAYHNYNLVYNPVTHLADLSVDGITRITGYSGNTTFKSNVGLYFGASSGGQGNINFAQVVSVPEPSSAVLFAAGAVALAVCYFHRSRRVTMASP